MVGDDTSAGAIMSTRLSIETSYHKQATLIVRYCCQGEKPVGRGYACSSEHWPHCAYPPCLDEGAGVAASARCFPCRFQHCWNSVVARMVTRASRDAQALASAAA